MRWSVVDAKTNAAEVIQRARKARGYTLDMLSKELGYTTSGGISMALSGKRAISVNLMFAMLDELGFDIIVKDRNGANRENVWKIEEVKEDAE